MKLIIAGGRKFNDYDMVCRVCDYYLQNQTEIEIVSGVAKGADLLGERYAEERGYKITRFPANWNLHKRSAGFIRNTEMAEYGDALIAFWNGKSKGTEHMIKTAKKHKLKVRVKYYG